MGRIILTCILATLFAHITTPAHAQSSIMERQQADFDTVRNKAKALIKENHWSELEQYLLSVLPSVSPEDRPTLGLIHSLLGNLYAHELQNEAEAEKHWQASLEYLPNKEDNTTLEKRMNILRKLAIAQDYLGKHEASLQNFLAALEIAKKLNVTKEQIHLHHSINIVYRNLEKYDQCLVHLQAAEKLINTYYPLSKELQNSIISYYADYYVIIKDYDKAISAAQKSITLSEELNNTYQQDAMYETLARAYMGKKEYQLALDAITKSLAIPSEAYLMRGTEYKTYGLILNRLSRKEEGCYNLNKGLKFLSESRNDKELGEVQKIMEMEQCKKQ